MSKFNNWHPEDSPRKIREEIKEKPEKPVKKPLEKADLDYYEENKSED